MSEFLNMGGYGFYVWSSFSISLLGLLSIYWFARRYEKQQQQDIRGWIKRRGHMKTDSVNG